MQLQNFEKKARWRVMRAAHWILCYYMIVLFYIILPSLHVPFVGLLHIARAPIQVSTTNSKNRSSVLRA